MPKYTVTATRETYYEFEVEAADELDAEDGRATDAVPLQSK